MVEAPPQRRENEDKSSRRPANWLVVRHIGITSKASTEQFIKAANRYSEVARNPDCPAITEAVAAEGVRIASNPGLRVSYDYEIAKGAPWPIDLPLTVRIGTAGISPMVDIKFCDACRAFPAKDITIPRLRLSILGGKYAAQEANRTRINRGVSPFIVRRCKNCGQQDCRDAPKVNWMQLAIVLIALVASIIAGQTVGIFIAGLILSGYVVALAQGFIRFGLLSEPQKITTLQNTP